MFKRKILHISNNDSRSYDPLQTNVLADAVEEKPYLSPGGGFKYRSEK